MNRRLDTNSDSEGLEQLETLQLQNELYRRAQVALEADRQESASMFENAPIGFFVLGEDGAIRRVNRRGADALGVQAEELVNMNFQRFVSEPSSALFAEHLAFAGGRQRSGYSDLLLRKANGASFWARTRSELSRSSERSDERIIFTIDDIDDLMLDMRSQIELTSSAMAVEPAPVEELGGRILVIDDEELVLNATVRVLHRMGYEIVSFTQPSDALKEFEEYPGAYDAIVTDFRMPGMNGLELSERLMALRHDIPILLTSAFTVEIDKARVEQIGIARVLQKPLSAEELGLWLAAVIPEVPNQT
jgi:PAS domain S-box-containing protein